MSEPEFEYILTRRLLARAEPTGETDTSGKIAKSDTGSFYFVNRSGSHVQLAIYDEITSCDLSELERAFAGTRTCELLITDCPGGCAVTAHRIGMLLADIGRENVVGRIRGYCHSGAVYLACRAGHLTADASSRFLLHAARMVLTRGGDDIPMSLVFAIHDEGLKNARAALALRLDDPDRFLNGEDWILSASEAKDIKLIDRIKYLD